MDIVRPLTADGLFGLDKNGTCVVQEVDGDHVTSWHVYDVRKMLCPICMHGWAETGPSIADQYKFKPFDKIAHLSCVARFHGLKDGMVVHAAIVSARILFRDLTETPNRYWPPADRWGKHKPWYTVELLDHPFSLEIGFRKNVWSIRVTALPPATCSWAEAAKACFVAEEVTKEFNSEAVLLHAWGNEKLREYVKTLAEVAGWQVRQDL